MTTVNARLIHHNSVVEGCEVPAGFSESVAQAQHDLVKGTEQGDVAMSFSPMDMVAWYGISATTAREWLSAWREETFVVPTRADAQRIRAYTLSEYWLGLLKNVLVNASVSAR